jgi:hypothetical protein
MSNMEPLSEPLIKATRAAVAFLGHAALSALVVASMRAFEWYIDYLWKGREPKLFGAVPLNYLFDFSDLCVLCVFIFWGLYEASEKMRGR